MSKNLRHRISISAPIEKVYQAITTEEGIRAWWTVDVKMGKKEGDKAVFGFFGHSTTFTMRIQKLKAPSAVKWKCVAATSKDWVGTKQEFKLKKDNDGDVVLKFTHSGWKSGGDHCYYCNTTWGHLLVCLKQYVEKGVKNPYFK